MTQYIHKPVFMDAGLRTSVLSHSAGAAHYVSPNTNVAPVDPCLITHVGFTGSATAKPVFVKAVPGCTVASDTQSIVKPCCDMIYEPQQYVSDCKVAPYYGTPAQMKQAGALKCCGDALPIENPE